MKIKNLKNLDLIILCRQRFRVKKFLGKPKSLLKVNSKISILDLILKNLNKNKYKFKIFIYLLIKKI